MSSKKKTKRAGRPGRDGTATDPASLERRGRHRDRGAGPAARGGRTLARAVALVLGGLILLALAVYGGLLVGLDDRIDPTPDRLVAAIRDGSAYLDRHLAEEGRFEYVVRSNGDPASRGKYNVLRHAGSLYGLGMALTVTDDDATRAAIVRGARYLLRRHVRSLPQVEGVSAVFSLPGEEVGARRVAKLGGAALGVLGLSAARAVDPTVVPPETLRRLGGFLVFMQEDDGHFVSKYDEQTGYLRDFDSVYYPGEAALALTALYDLDEDPKWIQASLDAVAFLERKRRDLPYWKLPNDHWLLIAMGALEDKFDVLDTNPISRRRMLEHGKDVARSMLREQWWTGWVPAMRGAFDANGRITPASTRLEGLIALHGALPEDDRFRGELEASIRRGVGFILRGQLDRPPTVNGGFLESLPGPFSPAAGKKSRRIRIDYVQHALSALVGLHRMETGAGGG